MATKKNNKQEVAPPEQRGVSAHVNTNYGDEAGAGMENTTRDDIKIPYLAVLQAMHPECDESSDDYVEGARPGMLMNSVTKELFDGKKGVVFVSCHRTDCWVEWKPRTAGGGMVARHDKNSEFVHAAKQASGKTFGTIPTDEGHELTQTVYLTGYLLEKPEDLKPSTMIVLSFSSTKLGRLKDIWTALHTVKDRPPLYAHKLLVRSVPEKNEKGSFHNFQITFLDGTLRNYQSGFIPRFDEDGQPHPLAVAGKQLRDSMMAGERQFADETAKSEGGTSGAHESAEDIPPPF